MDTNIVRTGRSAPRFHPFVFIACTALALAGSQGVSADTGGPDAAGYRFIDSSEAGGPAYDFEDISGTGTRIEGLSDDNMVGPFPLGFTFEYYGTDYTQIYMSSNCFLTVLAGQSNGCCSSEPIPDASNPNGIIAGWYEDVDPRVGDVYYQTLGTAPNRRFIVQWSAVKLYGFPDTITLEYKLFERDDSIEVHYQQAVTAGQVYAAGIENQDGTVGLQYYRGSGDLDTPLAVKYYLNPVVLSIARADASPTNASTVDYVATFSEGVTGVDVSDFALATSGVSGTSVSSVTPDSASVYTVTVNTGTGDGTLRLDLEDDDTITSIATSTELGGAGADNGDFSGETYTVDRTGPQADAINRLDANPTDAAQVGFIVKFDEPVDGVGTADFSTSTTGSLAGTSIDSVSPAFGNALDISNNPEVGGKHLNLGNDASLQVSAFTLEAWVYYQKDGAETIVAKGDGSGGTTDYIFQINKDGAGKLNLWAAGAWHSSTAAISPNTWTHVAVTYDGSDKKFYIGGALDNTAPHSGSVAQSAMNAYIGRQGQNADTGHYDGWVDEVRVWNVVREQAEIQATMSSTLMGGETGLVGYWRFEQFQDLGAGAAGVNDIQDCSSNSNHGDAVNSPSLTTSNFSGLAPDYIVRVNTGTGSGELGLRLEDDDSITDEATNPFGGAGEQDYTGGQTYTIIEPPTVTTTAVTDVAATTATSGGNVTADGGDAVTARGVCWSTSTDPTTADSKTTDGSGTGVFTSSITGLNSNTTYHVRAYATNNTGTAYGSDENFTTTAPTVQFTAASQSGAEDVGTLTVTAELSTASGLDVTVPYTLSGTAADPADYTITASPVVISAGDLTAAITITVVDDALDELDETVIVTMGTPTNATKGATDVHTATITDDDGEPTVQFTAASQSGAEDVGTLTVTAELSTASGLDVTVPYTLSGTAADPADYTITASPVVISAGDLTAAITITVVDDALDELDETVIVTMGTPTNATKGATDVHTATITDDDGEPTVQFTAASQSGAEDVGTLTVTAELSTASGLDVTVPYTLSGTAADPADYTITASPVVISAGDLTAAITITVVDDALDELDETVIVTMGTPTNATKGATDVHTATITDDDGEPTVQFTAASQSGAEDVGTLTVTAELSTASGLDVTVPYTLSGTAADPADYTITASPVVISAGDLTAAITITVVDDALDELDETVIVTMGTPTNATKGATDVHTATITDDDGEPTVQFTAASQSGAEDVGTLTVTAELSTASGLDVTVPYTLSGTAADPADYTITASPVVISAGDLTAAITITVVDDALDEADETVIVTMGTPTNATKGATDVHTATITDDDAPLTVTTTAVSNITTTTADCGGDVTDDGGADVTARGVCWSTSENPTVADSKTEDGSGAGSFTSNLTGLNPGTTYYVAAYATNSVGTAYGADVTFATVAEEPEPEPEPELAPDLRVTIEAQTAADALVGDDVVFVVTVENVGTATATDVVLTIPIPENAEFVSARLVTDPSAQTADLVVTLGDEYVTLELGDVPAGDFLQVEIVFRVTAAGEVTVNASATSEEVTTPKAAETAATIDAEDEYLRIVQTTTPVYLCGALGLAPLLVLAGLIGTKLRRRRRPEC